MQDGSTSGPDSPKVGDDSKPKKKLSSSCLETSPPQPDVQSSKTELTQNGDSSGTPQEKNVSILVQVNDSAEVVGDVSSGTSSVQKSTGHGLPLCIQKSTTISSRPIQSVRNRSAWGRAHVSICYLDVDMIFHMLGLLLLLLFSRTMVF